VVDGIVDLVDLDQSISVGEEEGFLYIEVKLERLGEFLFKEVEF